MSLAAIRDGIKARIETIPDIGKVWTYEPYVTRDEERAVYYESHGEIRAWTITRESTDETEEPPNTVVNFAAHLFVIRHFRSMNSHAASEQDFQDSVEAVRDALRIEQRNWFGLLDVFTCGPPSARLIGHIHLGPNGAGPFCHLAEITLLVKEQRSPNP